MNVDGFVIFNGLKSPGEQVLNGKRGKLLELSHDGRWCVQVLDEDRTVRIQPANLIWRKNYCNPFTNLNSI